MKFLKDYIELMKPIWIIYGLAMLFIYICGTISELQIKLKNKKR
jgi:hypothetical protein